MKMKLSWQENTALDKWNRVHVYAVSIDIRLDVSLEMGFVLADMLTSCH
jgi:hypothetical protein